MNMDSYYSVEYSPNNRAKCKRCKQTIEKSQLRICKSVTNPFDLESMMKQYHHVPCMFEAFKRCRSTTKIVRKIEDLNGFEDLRREDQARISAFIVGEVNAPGASSFRERISSQEDDSSSDENDELMFRDFVGLCQKINNESSSNAKKNILHSFVQKHDNERDLVMKLINPKFDGRKYNLKEKSLIKLLCDNILTSVEYKEAISKFESVGDAADVLTHIFRRNFPNQRSTLTLSSVDTFLSKLTSNNQHLLHFVQKCTPEEFRILMRLILKDLKINMGDKNVRAVQTTKTQPTPGTSISCMLAKPCLVPANIFKETQRVFAETKYDGERVQIHQRNGELLFFSRNHKETKTHIIEELSDVIPAAVPQQKDFIIDGEVVLVDEHGKQLPFGSLGSHKRETYAKANVCVFIFDCIFLDRCLLEVPLYERKEMMKKDFREIKNRFMFAEYEVVSDEESLREIFLNAVDRKLEGIVVKAYSSLYEPGKRKWWKMKKDCAGLGDTLDLIVLGGYYGKGSNGAKISTCLLGCFDTETQKFLTVTKCKNGLDQKEILELTNDENFEKVINREIPNWMNCKRSMIPDFIVKDPREARIWEVSGDQLTESKVHTAGVSLRFPKLKKIRDDKLFEDSTSFQQIEDMFRHA